MLSIRKLFVVLTISFLFQASFAHNAKQYHCLQFYAPTNFTKEAQNLSKYLNGPLGTSEASTVTTKGVLANRVVFVKDKDGMWVSKRNAVKDTLTAEGDIRLPIFLLGTELAAKLGFSIREISEKEIEVLVPDADLLADKITQINTSLKSRGLEPITYLPVRTGFVTVKETIQLILSAQGDYLVHFPYADHDLIIAPHEVSFHLGSILLSKKIISRSRIITEEFQKLIDLIETHKDQIGPLYRRLMGQLRIERNFEMDAGLASMVTSPGFTRRDGGMKSYAELYPSISERYRKYMVRNIEFLDRPRMQPFEAALIHLEKITGLDLSDLTSADRASFYTMEIPIARVGEKVALDSPSMQALKNVAQIYAKQSRPVFETALPQIWLEEFLHSMDQRIKEISDSLPN